MEAISIRLAKYHHFLHVCYSLPLLSYHCPFLSTDWLVCLHLNFFLPTIGQRAKAPPLRLQTVWLKNTEDSHQTIRSKFHNQNSLLSVASKRVHVRKKHVPVGCTHACFATKHLKFRECGCC